MLYLSQIHCNTVNSLDDGIYMAEKTDEDQQTGCAKQVVCVALIAAFGIPLIVAISVFVISDAIGSDNNSTTSMPGPPRRYFFIICYGNEWSQRSNR